MAVLNSPRFQGSMTIEQCLNGTRTMPPNNGASPETDADAVRRVQRALVDLGYLLSFDNVDGIYGNATAQAVSRFKFDRGIAPSDGIVGPKTSQALDDEFPPGAMNPGVFAPFVAASRLDSAVAGLLNELSGLVALPWASQTAVFALQELTNQNLAGIARASQANDLKAQVPVTEHATIDQMAAALFAAPPDTGPFGLTTRFDQAGWIRAYIVYMDSYLDRAAPGGERHTGAILSLSHELNHVRNRVMANTLNAEPITAADYVDVGRANAAGAGGDPTTFTRATFIEEIGCRHLAWKVYQDLVVNHAEAMLASGVLTRPAAVGELTTTLLAGQLFRATIKFAIDGLHTDTYHDNGYMSSIEFFHPLAIFNQQAAIWMQTANRFDYHNEAARTGEIRDTLTNEFNAASPGFATPNVAPAGLIGG
jgi:Putative peptidoglycan binding domain